MTLIRSRAAGFALGLSILAFAGCAQNDTPSQEAGDTTTDEQITLRVAHFPNVTHAPAIFGLQEGIFEEALGAEVKLDVKTFNSGTEAITALFAEDIDISYIGPNPAINGFQQSRGEAVRIIAGAASGGAALVTKPELTSADDLKGKTIGSPSLGNTQDVALRAWLADEGLTATKEGGGDVSIKPQENAQTLETFRSGDIDGAWVPEPWASRLVIEGGGKVLLDEGTLWDDGKYATTLVIVRKAFLDDHPDVVEDFLKGHVEALDQMAADSDAAKAAVNDGLESITGKALDDEVLDSAWEHLNFTYDPLVDTIKKSATDAKAVGLLEDDEIDGIEDLEILNEVLDGAGKEAVDA
jgi:NitT/TauT family transport system substrate-binding protein